PIPAPYDRRRLSARSRASGRISPSSVLSCRCAFRSITSSPTYSAVRSCFFCRSIASDARSSAPACSIRPRISRLVVGSVTTAPTLRPPRPPLPLPLALPPPVPPPPPLRLIQRHLPRPRALPRPRQVLH